MEIYLIKVNASIILFYLCYKLLFQRDTFWMLRRTYLMVSVLFSFIYPLFSIEGWLKKQEPIMSAISSIQLDELVISPSGVRNLGLFTVENVLWAVFGLVALFMTFHILIQFYTIVRRRLKGTKTSLMHIPIIRIDEKITPFSFFQWIFINPKLYSESETAVILEHELTHVRQFHSVDVIVAQIQKMFCWFNPAAWLLEREIRHNLEYLADNQVLNSGFEPKKYQYHLLSLSYEPAESKLGNQFNVSPIKKRIKMMNSKKTKKSGLLKYALIIPIALVMLLMSTMQDMIAATKNSVLEQTPQEVKIPISSSKIVQGKRTSVDSEIKGIAVAEIKEHKEKESAELDEIVVVGYSSNEKQDSENDKKVFDVVEVPPVFAGGEKAMFEYLSKNIRYPVEAQKQKIQGRVVVQFVVNDEGKVSNAKIVYSIDTYLDAEALRIINAMPDWTPGKQGGKNVSVRYVLPIQFKLQGNEKTESPAKSLSGKVAEVDSKDSQDSGVDIMTTKTTTTTTSKLGSDVLVVLDGIIIPNSQLNDIDPKDIESISVLKDKSATELYGEKGKNGVIIITSKK